MGSYHVISTKFSEQSHDALKFTEKHMCPRDRLGFWLHDSVFEFKFLNLSDREKYKYIISFKHLSLLLNFGIFSLQ